MAMTARSAVVATQLGEIDDGAVGALTSRESGATPAMLHHWKVSGKRRLVAPTRLHPGHADADCQYALWEKRRSGGVAGAGSMYLASRPRPEERVAASGYHCIRQLALLPSGHNAICLRPSR